MKKRVYMTLTAASLLCVAATTTDTPMTAADDGTCIVNSTTLCKARGFRKTTPVEVHIRKGKVVKVVTLKNEESPTYFEKVKKNLLPLFEDVKVDRAIELTEPSAMPDGCTGATYSTKAVQKNIREALEYYKAHK